MREYQFRYYTPTKVFFGAGAIEHLDESLAPYGKKVLMVFDKNTATATGIYDYVTNLFREKGYQWWEYDKVDPNPRLRSVIEGAKICKENDIEAVLAIGGGSVIDCSKAIRAAAFFPGDLDDYDGLWAWGATFGAVTKTLPMVVICTMASTGSEMDGGAVITNEHTHQKGGAFMGDLFLPNVSILDPKYTYSVPKRHVAAGAADIFIHTSETYFDPATDIDLVDGFAESIMKTVAKYAPIALKEPENFEARANLMWAAPWAINGLLSGGRMSGWTLHGLQHPMGAYHDIIHGQGLAILMPHWMRHILSDATVDRFVRYGVNVFGIDPSLDKYEIANKAIEATEDLFFNKMEIPRTLSAIGMTDEYFDEMATQATARPMGMYVPLTKEEVIEIYKAAL